MEDLLLTIPFNSQNYIAQCKTVWEHALSKSLRSYSIYSIVPPILISVGFALQDKTDLSPFLILVGFIMLFYIFVKWLDFFKKRKVYFRSVKEIAKKYEDEKFESTYKFTEAFIEYADKDKMYKFNWSLFAPQILYKDIIMLRLNSQNEDSFALSKTTLGEKNYQLLTDFLSKKLSHPTA
jgi:hypothetical protein